MKKRLKKCGISKKALKKQPLGQHFILKESVLDKVLSSIGPTDTVVEIGAGLGRLTEKLANKCENLISYEIDKRFKPVLDEISDKYKKVEIIYKNVLEVKLPEFDKIVGNLPFDISEPLFKKLIKKREVKKYDIGEFKFEKGIFILGESFVKKLKADLSDKNFSNISVVVPAYFKVNIITKIPKKAYSPMPETDTYLVEIDPKSKEEILKDKKILLTRLFYDQSDKKVKNSLTESFITYSSLKKEERITKREAAGILNKFELSKDILEKKVKVLNNKEIKEIYEHLPKFLEYLENK